MQKITWARVILGCCLMLAGQTLFADDYSDAISEAFLRTQFAFKADENLKYSQCEGKTMPTCAYVWGPESSKDAARINAGLTPKGYKLMVVYAQAKQDKDFQRVLGSYSDAVVVEGFGKEAVWSSKRKQLSLMTDDNLIIHVNLSGANIDSKEKASSIAEEVLVNLSR